MEETPIIVAQDAGTDPCTWQYYECLKKRTIIFNQAVMESIVEMVYLPLKQFEEDDSTAPVTLILSTPGGSVLDGMVMLNIIDSYKKRLNIIVYGCALSMGALFLCAGNKNPNVHKYCYPFSVALIHDGSTAVSGESGSVEDTINFNHQVDEMIRDYILTNTKITEEEYNTKAKRHQWYLTASEMKEKGLIDTIIGVDAE